jgi:hypothetical protein
MFVGETNFFIFLERHVSTKDNLLAETRKSLYRIIAEYIKLRKVLILDYLDIIYVPLITMSG